MMLSWTKVETLPDDVRTAGDLAGSNMPIVEQVVHGSKYTSH